MAAQRTSPGLANPRRENTSSTASQTTQSARSAESKLDTLFKQVNDTRRGSIVVNLSAAGVSASASAAGVASSGATNQRFSVNLSSRPQDDTLDYGEYV